MCQCIYTVYVQYVFIYNICGVLNCCVLLQMYYYRYESAEVSCCYKYLMFSYNIIFWVSYLLTYIYTCSPDQLFTRSHVRLTEREHCFL